MTSNIGANPSAHLSFPDSSTLDLLIPADSEFNIESHLLQGSETRAESRTVLFFEELLPVYVILRSSLQSLEHILRDIELTVTAHATPASPPPRLQQNGQTLPPEKPVKLTLDAITLTNHDTPVLSDISDGSSRSCVVWKVDLHLRYPSQKLHRPSVHFTASAVPKASEVDVPLAETSQNDYMNSTVPTSENLLQGLHHGINLAEKQPCLPSSRLQKVAPRASPALQETRPLRTSSRLFPVFAALAVRVHITPEYVTNMILTLDLEPTRHAEYGGVQIKEIKTEGENVVVEPFSLAPTTPDSSVTLQPGDRSTFLYKLTQEHDLAPQPAKLSSILFNISAIAHLSESCHVQIQARWHGNIHFPQPQSPSNNLRNSIRPQSIGSTLAPQDIAPPRPPSKRVSHTGRPISSATNIEIGGVLFAFTGPENVIEGETFHLDVFVVNRSSRRRKLAIVAIPKPPRTNPSAAHNLKFPNISRQDSKSVADAVLDDRTVFNLQDRRESRVAEVVCLNADVRVGPLPSGTCHNVQIEFLTLSSGLVGLAAVHVVDLDTRETTQITELPDIMVSKA